MARQKMSRHGWKDLVPALLPIFRVLSPRFSYEGELVELAINDSRQNFKFGAHPERRFVLISHVNHLLVRT